VFAKCRLMRRSVRAYPSRVARAAGDSVLTLAPLVVLPALVIPALAFLIVGSFRTLGPGAPEANFTLDNWLFVLQARNVRAVANSLVLGSTTAVLSVIAGTGIAWFLVRTDLFGRRALGSLIIVPLLFSPLLTTLAYVGIAGPNAGLINVLAKQVAGAHGPIVDIYSLPGMVFVLLLHYTPYVYLAVRSALLNSDPDLEAASRVLGASVLTTARRITFPIIAPAVLSGGLLVFVIAAEEFSVPSILGTVAGIPTLPYVIYENVAEFPARPTRASALGLVLLLIMLTTVYFYIRSLGSGERHVTLTGKGSRGDLVHLAIPLRVLGLGAIAAYLCLAVLLPYAVLLFGSFSSYFATTHFDVSLFTLKNYQDLFASSRMGIALRNTALLVLTAASATTLLAALLSRVSVRGRPPWRRIVDYLAVTPVFIPGVVLGLGMLWAYVSIPLGLYGTIGILLLAYTTRFVGHGTRIVSAGYRQLSRQLEEAAYTLGSSQARTFLTITLPLLRTSLAATWLLVAIFSSLEISSSMFLYTGDSMTAAVFVYLTMSGGVLSQAFSAAAVLATLTFGLVSIAQWRLRALDKF